MHGPPPPAQQAAQRGGPQVAVAALLLRAGEERGRRQRERVPRDAPRRRGRIGNVLQPETPVPRVGLRPCPFVRQCAPQPFERELRETCACIVRSRPGRHGEVERRAGGHGEEIDRDRVFPVPGITLALVVLRVVVVHDVRFESRPRDRPRVVEDHRPRARAGRRLYPVWLPRFPRIGRRRPAEHGPDTLPRGRPIVLTLDPDRLGPGAGHALEAAAGQTDETVDRMQMDAGVLQSGSAGEMQGQRARGRLLKTPGAEAVQHRGSTRRQIAQKRLATRRRAYVVDGPPLGLLIPGRRQLVELQPRMAIGYVRPPHQIGDAARQNELHGHGGAHGPHPPRTPPRRNASVPGWTSRTPCPAPER